MRTFSLILLLFLVSQNCFSNLGSSVWYEDGYYYSQSSAKIEGDAKLYSRIARNKADLKANHSLIKFFINENLLINKNLTHIEDDIKNLAFSEILKSELKLNGLDIEKIYNQGSNVSVTVKISKVNLVNQLGGKIKELEVELNSLF